MHSNPDPVTEALIKEIIGDCSEELKKSGIKLGDMIDCGNYGCVFYSDNEKVVKVTKHKKEADAAHFILKHPSPHTSLPEVSGVWTWDSCHSQGPVYIILREDLKDLSCVDPVWFGRVMDDFEADLQNKAVVTKTLTEDDIDEALVEIFANTNGKTEDESKVEDLSDLFIWNLNNNIWLDDVIVSNWGQRPDGTIVIRDLGAVQLL